MVRYGMAGAARAVRSPSGPSLRNERHPALRTTIYRLPVDDGERSIDSADRHIGREVLGGRQRRIDPCYSRPSGIWSGAGLSATYTEYDDQRPRHRRPTSSPATIPYSRPNLLPTQRSAPESPPSCRTSGWRTWMRSKYTGRIFDHFVMSFSDL